MGGGTLLILLLIFIVSAFSTVIFIKCSIMYNTSISNIIFSIITKTFLITFSIIFLYGILRAIVKHENESTLRYIDRRTCMLAILFAIAIAFGKHCIQRDHFVSISDCWNGL
jgi:hypothetical protein